MGVDIGDNKLVVATQGFIQAVLVMSVFERRLSFQIVGQGGVTADWGTVVGGQGAKPLKILTLFMPGGFIID